MTAWVPWPVHGWAMRSWLGDAIMAGRCDHGWAMCSWLGDELKRVQVAVANYKFQLHGSVGQHLQFRVVFPDNLL